MSAFVDFADVKARVSLEQALTKLGITLEKRGAQLRGRCPICNGKNDRGFVATPAKGLWYCFSENVGGDVIQLAALVRQIELRDAALWLIGETVTVERSTVPSTVNSNRKDHAAGGFQPLDYLQTDHPAVEAVGFDQDTALALGIGYAPKGLMRGMVAVPVRLEDGTLAGYIGITEAKVPPKFHLTSNVVSFTKKTA